MTGTRTRQNGKSRSYLFRLVDGKVRSSSVCPNSIFHNRRARHCCVDPSHILVSCSEAYTYKVHIHTNTNGYLFSSWRGDSSVDFDSITYAQKGFNQKFKDEIQNTYFAFA
jgi:hypothetical protein